MARLRISRPAQADLAYLLETSAERWGAGSRRRYAALLAAATRLIAGEPATPLACDRPELLRGVRSLHVRHARNESSSNKVKEPVHIIYYRAADPGLIEIVRVLHEHMEPSRHLGTTGRALTSR